MFIQLNRTRLVVIALLAATSVVAISTTSGAQSVEVESSASTYSLHSTATAGSMTPGQARATYLRGSTVYFDRVWFEGGWTTPNVTRIVASNGLTYAVMGLQNEFWAIDESNASVWDTHGDPYNSAKWSMASISDIAHLAHWFLTWPIADASVFQTIIAILAVLVIIFMFIWEYWLKDWWKYRDRGPKQMNQWSNIGLVLYDYVPFYDEAGFYHPGLRPDIAWTVGHNPELKQQLERNPHFTPWLEHGRTPAMDFALS